MAKKQLIFVHNADGGTLNAIMDSAHKLFAPSTYQCSLCAITHGMLTMRHEWKDYVRNLPYETRFYHRDGFRQEWPNQQAKLPAQRSSCSTKMAACELLSAQRTWTSKSAFAQFTAMLGRNLAEHSAS